MKFLKGILFLSVVSVLSSCSNSSSLNESQEQSASHHIDTTDAVEYIEVKDSLEPCDPLLDFVVYLENEGWQHDTNRLNKYGHYQELERKQMHIFDDYPFFKIDLKRHRMLNINLRRVSNHPNYPHKYLDTSFVNGIQSIWGYHYRDTANSSIVSDGVLEQISFTDSVQAQGALEAMAPLGSIIYFNTQPYFYRIRNRLFIFQTRSNGFSYDQKPLFKKFVEMNSTAL